MESADSGRTSSGRVRRFLRTPRPSLYVLIVVAVAVGTICRQLRVESVFACPANGYASDQYVAYCAGTQYGDYDHGAFWFALEPEAQHAAARADVLFLGNSRMQFGFSAKATAQWFSVRSISYYLLGFAYDEKHPFEEALLHRLRPRASLYVVNIDAFFETAETEPARFVMHDARALGRYQSKRRWQLIHESMCAALPALCGRANTFFRSRRTGAFSVAGETLPGAPAADDPVVNHEVVAQHSATGQQFLHRLPVEKDCVILTIVPNGKTQRATADAIATTMGLKLIAPQLDSLRTFDGSHLDSDSAERWSRAFFDASGPTILRCLQGSRESRA